MGGGLGGRQKVSHRCKVEFKTEFKSSLNVLTLVQINFFLLLVIDSIIIPERSKSVEYHLCTAPKPIPQNYCLPNTTTLPHNYYV